MLIYNVFSGNSDIINAFLQLIAILAVILPAIMLHEVSHGYAAYLSGDYTAKAAGRLTLNPVKHFDLFGTLMMLMVGFGWAKPVPIDSRNFRDYKKGMIFTSLAGVGANLIMAIFSIICICIVTAVFKAADVIVLFNDSTYFVAASSQAARYAYMFFYYLCVYGVLLNMTLFLFNLIPVYPLDGFRVVETLAKPDNRYVAFNYRYGNFLLIGVILIFTLLGYLSRYMGGVNLNVFSLFQGKLLDLLDIIQRSILRG